jgi:hypothetical protein
MKRVAQNLFRDERKKSGRCVLICDKIVTDINS